MFFLCPYCLWFPFTSQKHAASWIIYCHLKLSVNVSVHGALHWTGVPSRYNYVYQINYNGLQLLIKNISLQKILARVRTGCGEGVWGFYKHNNAMVAFATVQEEVPGGGTHDHIPICAFWTSYFIFIPSLLLQKPMLFWESIPLDFGIHSWWGLCSISHNSIR